MDYDEDAEELYNSRTILHFLCMKTQETKESLYDFFYTVKNNMDLVDSKDIDGCTPAMYCCRYGGKRRLMILITLGKATIDNPSYIKEACIKGHLDVVNIIVTIIKQVPSDFLHSAVASQNVLLVEYAIKYIISNNLDIDSCDHYGNTALTNAIGWYDSESSESLDIIDLLKESIMQQKTIKLGS